MIGYVTLGTRDMARAAAFYDALPGEPGAKRAMDSEQLIMGAVGPRAPMVAIVKPRDGRGAGRPARRQLLCRLLPRPRRQQAQRVLHDHAVKR